MDKIGPISKEATISTFHAFALKLIKQFIEYTSLSAFFKIIDVEERNRYLATVANELKLPRYILKIFKENIHAYKEGYMSIPIEFQELHIKLQQKLDSMRMIEIDDLIPIATKLMKEHQNVISYLQNKYHYVLVDEYQDINQQQYEFILPLINFATQFTAVGDDDQCIYEWRGSRPELMRELSENTDVTNIFLTHNYRSQKNIIEFSNRIISHNKIRIEKNMIPTISPLSIPEFRAFKTRKEEAQYISGKITHIIKNTSTQFSEIAILVRNDNQIATIISELNHNKIPFINHNSKIMLTKWFLDYMRELSMDFPDYSKLINFPKNIIDKFLFEELCNTNSLDSTKPIEAIKFIYERNIEFHDSIIFRSRYETIIYLLILKAKGTILEVIDSLYENLLNSGDHLNENEIIYFNIAMSVARDYINLNESPTLSGYCDYFELIIEEMTHNAEDGIQLMTIHKAKGLEFDCVFIPGIDVETFPNPYFVTNNSYMEAERRLLYVGITRTKEHLFMSSGNEFAFDSKLFDGFVTEIKQSLVDKNAYREIVKTEISEKFAEKIVETMDDKVFTDVAKKTIDTSNFKEITKNVILKWVLVDYPMLSREIQSICENTENILSDISRKLEPSRPILLNNRSFLYGVLKLIIDGVLNKKSAKVTEYLKFNTTGQGIELMKLYESFIKSGKVNKSYAPNDLSNLVEYKNYLDALHHQFEPTKRKDTGKIIESFRKMENYEKISLLLSPIKFLFHTTISSQAIETIESTLKK